MKTSTTGLSLIARFEGFSPVPYLCPAGYLTIGYGHVMRAGEVFEAITDDVARALLARDVAVAERAIHRLITTPLTQHQFDALISFTFNLGSGALQRSSLRRLINRGEHDAVTPELLRWVWAGGRKLPGLVRRRAAEGRLYSS